MCRSVLLLALLIAGGAWPQQTVSVTVAVTGGQASSGEAMISLFDSRQAWMKRPLVEASVPIDQRGEASHVFRGLAPGEYAAVVVYDIDSDGELDTGFLGIPKEKIGFSNDARGRLGPASWDDARVDVSADAVVRINLVRAKR